MYYNRGLAYGDKGEHDKAITDFTEAIRLDPKYAQAYHNRGVAYDKKGERAEAEEDFTEAEKLGYEPSLSRKQPHGGLSGLWGGVLIFGRRLFA